MPRYIRAIVPGGTFFFTVTLLERQRQLLTEYIDDLRAVFVDARRRRPFTVDAIVVLPDHLHCIWTLPPDDSVFKKVFFLGIGLPVMMSRTWRWNNTNGGMRYRFPALPSP